MRKFLKWMIISTCLTWLVGCAPPAEVVSVTATRPVATETPMMTATAVRPTYTPPPSLPTSESQPVPMMTPTPLPTVQPISPPAFHTMLGYFHNSNKQPALRGLVAVEDGWEIQEMLLPSLQSTLAESDYAIATNRLLYWNGRHATGPGSVAGGDLHLVDLSTGARQLLFVDNVVAALWAPNGQDFAYILATPETYELRWRNGDGEDKRLAIDVPRAFSIAPSGDKVAFTRETGYGGTAENEPGLYVVDVNTGAEVRISPLDRAGYGGSGPYWRPFWSADSSQVLLYAAADDDRTAVPHEAGYAWATADGAFSHFLPTSQFLAHFTEPLADPGTYRCLSGPRVLFDSNVLVQLVSECQPMGLPETWQLAVFYWQPETEEIDRVEILPVSGVVDLLDWDIRGESVLVLQGEDVISVPLPSTNQ